jgi:putative hydroxymethylpyrimidine transport system substrate-binding protein
MRFALIALIALLFAAPARAAEPFTVYLDWFLNPDHGPLVIAQEKGYFAEAGLEVEMIEPADPNDPPKLIAAGQGDVAISYQPQLHIFADQGLPLSRIATLVATPLNTLVTLADGPVTSIADLEGRKVGFSVGGFEDALLGAMLAEEGLGLDDVELINVNFSLSPALLSGQVDAVVGAFRNFELNQLALEGAEGRAFYPEEHGVPAYDELIVVARNDRLGDPKLRAFLTAIERGVQYLVNHPEESWRIFAGFRDGLDDELNARAWEDTLPRFALRPGALYAPRYEAFAAFLEARGLVETTPPVDSYAVELD